MCIDGICRLCSKIFSIDLCKSIIGGEGRTRVVERVNAGQDGRDRGLFSLLLMVTPCQTVFFLYNTLVLFHRLLFGIGSYTD